MVQAADREGSGGDITEGATTEGATTGVAITGGAITGGAEAGWLDLARAGAVSLVEEMASWRAPLDILNARMLALGRQALESCTYAFMRQATEVRPCSWIWRLRYVHSGTDLEWICRW